MDQGKLSDMNSHDGSNFSNKFSAHKDVVEDLLRKDTVGLVTFQDFRARREYLERCAVAEAACQNASRRAEELETKKKRVKRANLSRLSFGDSLEDQEENSVEFAKITRFASSKKANGVGFNTSGQDIVKEPDVFSPKEEGFFGKQNRKIGMDPGVDTSFLPDRDREQEERLERERLKQQWLSEQERVKNEEIDIIYSIWDGRGQRKLLSCKKGTTIAKFLSIVQQKVSTLKHCKVEDLMFIKEDMIIPHHLSFYDLISMKARGKNGSLFCFDVHEDIRIRNDASVEKDDSHAAKVVERRWYERNKHIYPASMWEVFDVSKNYGRVQKDFFGN
ncbi:Protein FAM50 [Galdieria sulphuraria]|nr:Protein FAM50 [Galdieria sulphuraria]